jgi:hypothetical protein
VQVKTNSRRPRHISYTGRKTDAKSWFEPGRMRLSVTRTRTRIRDGFEAAASTVLHCSWHVTYGRTDQATADEQAGL